MYILYIYISKIKEKDCSRKKWRSCITSSPSIHEMLKRNPLGRKKIVIDKNLHLNKEMKSAGSGIYKGKNHFSHF